MCEIWFLAKFDLTLPAIFPPNRESWKKFLSGFLRRSFFFLSRERKPASSGNTRGRVSMKNWTSVNYAKSLYVEVLDASELYDTNVTFSLSARFTCNVLMSCHHWKPCPHNHRTLVHSQQEMITHSD